VRAGAPRLRADLERSTHPFVSDDGDTDHQNNQYQSGLSGAHAQVGKNLILADE
jgi:hypothetical protein